MINKINNNKLQIDKYTHACIKQKSSSRYMYLSCENGNLVLTDSGNSENFNTIPAISEDQCSIFHYSANIRPKHMKILKIQK